MTSNTGYQINFSYQGTDVNLPAWRTPSQVTLYKSSNLAAPLAQLNFTASGQVTDLLGRSYNCPGCDFRVGGQVEISSGSFYLPGEGTATKTVNGTIFSYASPAMVTSVNQDGTNWNYAYSNWRAIQSPAGYGYDKVTVTGPDGYQQVYNVAVGSTKQPNKISSIVDSIGRTTSYSYDTSARPIQITYPEGNSVQVAYDNRGNIVSKVYNPKPGSGLAAKTETATIDTAACAVNRVLCYRITSFTDAMGRVTNYTYDSAGRLVQQTDPPDANGVRRAKILTYGSSFTAPVEVKVCGVGTTCGTSSEFKTQYTYLGATPLVLSETAIDGATGATLTTTYSYDDAGRLLVADGPIAGTGDAKYVRYDAVGRKTWEIGPADNNGLRPATRYTYRNADDRVTVVEAGTVSDPYSTTLNILTRVDTTYDVRRNPIQVATSAGGTTYNVTNASFDSRNRPVCSAIRMNAAAFGSLPADACALGAQGSQGPDRVSRNVYDAAGQLLQIQRAVGTSIQQNYVTYAYTGNGKQASVTDANGNLATYTYDGFDNLTRWTFPSLSTPGQVNAADYEAYTYDAAGNRTTLRKRDGSVIQFTFDQLNRVVSKTVPERAGLDPSRTRDVYYGYDMRGLQLYARFDSHSGEGITMAYDGFGRPTSETKVQNGGWVLGSGYDVAGNRTSFTYADGQSAWSSYDNLGRLSATWRSGTYIAVFGYNSSMQLAWQDNANGMRTDFSYDPIGRISSFSNNFYNNPAQGGWNNLYTFSRNTSGQITARTQSNDTFAWTNHINVDRPYSVNGLNQYTTAGSVGFTYDANGNLTSDGSTTYTYDPENRLVAASGAKNAQLYYDPLGRLHAITGSAGTTYFIWDGNALVMEYNGSGQVLRRYVHGNDAKADDPIAWYEGTAFDGSTERWLRTDERGSVVAVANATTVLAVNAYDEYGIPQSTNVGRFQYTGQAWISELGLYHYKARFYSPTLGRFMQIDPVGYNDQINLYAYVGNDPTNLTDPTGAVGECTGTLICNSDGTAKSGGRVNPGLAGSASGSSEGVVPGGQKSAAQLNVSSTGAGQYGTNSSSPSSSSDDAEEIRSNAADRLATNVVTGLRAEELTRQGLNSQGIKIEGEQVYVRAADGRLRIIDFIIRTKYGLAAIEVKANGAALTRRQLEIDNILRTQGGTVVSRNLPPTGGLFRGQHITLPTAVFRWRVVP